MSKNAFAKGDRFLGTPVDATDDPSAPKAFIFSVLQVDENGDPVAPGGGSSSGPAMTEYSVTLTGAGNGEEILAAGNGNRFLSVTNLGPLPVVLNLAGADPVVGGIPVDVDGVFILDIGLTNSVTALGTVGTTLSVIGGT